MAYMSTEHARTIRNNIKKEFPKYKFSIRRHHYSGISITLLKSDLDFSIDLEKHKPYDYIQINEYYLERYSNSDVLKKIKEIANEGNHNNSDIMTDYFDIGWYIYINIGDYDKPYVCSK